MILVIDGIVHPKCFVSRRFKPVRISFFCWTQKKSYFKECQWGPSTNTYSPKTSYFIFSRRRKYIQGE